MKKAILILAAAALAASCHDNSSNLRRDQQNYGVVQEGATGAVTTTINGPGEVPPPMTATNADNTSNLTLLPGTGTAPGQPGSLAGTLALDQNGSMSTGYPTDATGASPRPGVTRPAAPRVATQTTTPVETHRVDTTTQPVAPAMTSASPAPPSAAPPPPTDATSTVPADSTRFAEREKDQPKESNPSETAPPATDTSTTTAPPPTST